MSEEKKCIEYVTDSGGWYRSHCGKKAGHGSGGFYCKRHASRHPSGEEETVTWYKMGVLGQRCTAVLPIVFAVSDNPLMIDQPEDNLDNEFINDTVRKIVQDQKTKRQLISLEKFTAEYELVKNTDGYQFGLAQRFVSKLLALPPKVRFTLLPLLVQIENDAFQLGFVIPNLNVGDVLREKADWESKPGKSKATFPANRDDFNEGQIVPVQVERYTDKTLTILGRGRVAIDGYYRTRSEVILAEIEKQEKKINAYQMQLRLAEQCVVKLQALLAKESEPQMNND